MRKTTMMTMMFSLFLFVTSFVSAEDQSCCEKRSINEIASKMTDAALSHLQKKNEGDLENKQFVRTELYKSVIKYLWIRRKNRKER